VFCLQILPDVLRTERDVGWRDLLLEPAATARTAADADFTREIRRPLPGWSSVWRPGRRRCGYRTIRSGDNQSKTCVRSRSPGGEGGSARPPDPASIRNRAARAAEIAEEAAIQHRFLRPVFRPAPLKSYLRDCKKLQQTLADINDTETVTATAERLVKGKRLDLAPAVGALAEQLGCRRNDGMSGLAKRWNAFSDQRRFWG
jgi:hypothetical protein